MLTVQQGKNSESWEKFFERVGRLNCYDVELAVKLWAQREGRHGDKFFLANLIEACKDSLCEEPRDKIYGFFGIAHDCQDNSLPVDYSKSLFEVYEDVMSFENQLIEVNTEVDESLKLSADKHSKSIVHFSQLVQKVLVRRSRVREFIFELDFFYDE